jgi:hypothetical protein
MYGDRKGWVGLIVLLVAVVMGAQKVLIYCVGGIK